jgi:hypothetical protein
MAYFAGVATLGVGFQCHVQCFPEAHLRYYGVVWRRRDWRRRNDRRRDSLHRFSNVVSIGIPRFFFSKASFGDFAKIGIPTLSVGLSQLRHMASRCFCWPSFAIRSRRRDDIRPDARHRFASVVSCGFPWLMYAILEYWVVAATMGVATLGVGLLVSCLVGLHVSCVSSRGSHIVEYDGKSYYPYWDSNRWQFSGCDLSSCNILAETNIFGLENGCLLVCSRNRTQDSFSVILTLLFSLPGRKE